MNPQLKRALKKLDSPWKIQEFVSRLHYNPDDFCKSAEQVFLKKSAHCFEGAIFAGLALEQLGHEPRLLQMRSHRDDDHVVALFQEKGFWGAIGKSNTTLLGWRDPVFSSVDALLYSYFPFYFNQKGQMSLTAWAGPIRLKKYERKWNWRSGLEDVSEMSLEFYEEPGWEIMSEKALEKLPPANSLLTQACFLGANQKGLYKA